MTGNLLLIRKDESIPADVVLLSSFNEEGLAFVETAELDGETNLKIKVLHHEMNFLLTSGFLIIIWIFDQNLYFTSVCLIITLSQKVKKK